jgi:putative hemolysin
MLVRRTSSSSAPRILVVLLMLAALIAIATQSTTALRNPAAVYCTTLGYNYSVEKTAEGDDIGHCALPQQDVDAWSFLQGESGEKYNYCAKQGYALKVSHDPAVCGRLMASSCAVCVLKNGTEEEVTALMGLTFAETTCGDTHCGYPENAQTCPQDCPKDGIDMHCDRPRDGTCDPDCDGTTREQSDPDCPGQGGNIIWWITLTAVIIAVVAAVIVVARKTSIARGPRRRKRR